MGVTGVTGTTGVVVGGTTGTRPNCAVTVTGPEALTVQGFTVPVHGLYPV